MSATHGGARPKAGRPVGWRKPPATPDWSTVPSPENVLFAWQLRAWRTSNGLALRELCAALRCSLSTLVPIEKGGPVSASMARRFVALRRGGPQEVRAMMALDILLGRK